MSWLAVVIVGPFVAALVVAEFIRRGRGPNPWREDFDPARVNRYRDALPTLRESALACGCCGDRGTDGGCPVCGVTS